MDGEMKVEHGGGRQSTVRVDYPANSQRSKAQKLPERETVEKIVSGDVVRRRQRVPARFFRALIAEDAESVVGYVVMEVLVPAAKNMILDTLTEAAQRILYGDSRPRSAATRTGYTNYSARFGTGTPRNPGSPVHPTLTRQQRATHDFSDIIISSRAEAEDVLDRLRDLINTYEVATVSDLYDLVGLTGEFTDDKWGWYDLRSASVRAIRGGYLLHLPRTQPLT